MLSHPGVNFLSHFFRQYYGRHHALVNRYGISVSLIFPWICFACRSRSLILLISLGNYHVISTETNMTNGTGKAHYAYSLGAPVLLNL